jgi:RNA polymerase sigma-70 factor (ECF subfamily)
MDFYVNKYVRENVMNYEMDESLLRRAQQGDMEAFATLFEPLRATALTVAARYVGRSDAEDVVMNAFLKAWQGVPSMRGRNLKGWLLQIVRHCALDIIRKRQRHPHQTLDAPYVTDGPTREQQIDDPTADSPGELAARHDDTHRVQLALGELPALYRISLLLRYADGLGYSEIAEATGVSIGTVMSRLHNGKRILRKQLTALNEHVI